MDPKPTRGVMIFASLYMILALVWLLEPVAVLILTSEIFEIFPDPNGSTAPIGGLYLILAAVFYVLISLFKITLAVFMLVLSRGLLKLSNRIRRTAIVINCILALYALTVTWALVYNVANASPFQKILIDSGLILGISATYYLTRPKVKEQFR